MMGKLCLRCEEIKPISDFHRHAGKRDGRQVHCKLCRKISAVLGWSR